MMLMKIAEFYRQARADILRSWGLFPTADRLRKGALFTAALAFTYGALILASAGGVWLAESYLRGEVANAPKVLRLIYPAMLIGALVGGSIIATLTIATRRAQ